MSIIYNANGLAGIILNTTSISIGITNSSTRWIGNELDTFSSSLTATTASITSSSLNDNLYSVTASGAYAVVVNDEGYLRNEIRRIMKENMRPSVMRNRTHLDWAYATPAEIKARETLRDMITEAEWRRYVTSAFIMVRGKSGNIYQIFGNRNILHVYREGKKIQTICIHTDKVPPTDHVLNMKILIELDEEAVLAGGNIRPVKNYKKPTIYYRDKFPVSQIFKRINHQRFPLTGSSSILA